MTPEPPINHRKCNKQNIKTIAIVILVTIAILLLFYYRDISNYCHYRPALHTGILTVVTIVQNVIYQLINMVDNNVLCTLNHYICYI